MLGVWMKFLQHAQLSYKVGQPGKGFNRLCDIMTKKNEIEVTHGALLGYGKKGLEIKCVAANYTDICPYSSPMS